MADVTSLRRNIQTAEVAYKAAVSESTWNKIGGAINFINNYINKQYELGCAGPYSTLTVPYTDIGTQEVFERASQITQIFITYGESGSSGTSEFDIQWAADNSGTWASIFSTTPKVLNTATNDNVFDMSTVCTLPSGCTRPVLSKTTFAAGDKLRCNIVSSTVGGADFIMTVKFIPL